MTVSTEHYENTRRVVRVSLSDGVITLRSPMGTLDPECIVNLEAFCSQIFDGNFLTLERREKDIYKILGIIQNGSILHEIYEIAEMNDLDFGFPEEVEEEVYRWTHQAPDFSDCRDLRDIPFVTVDGKGTRDLDQALYIGEPGDSFECHVSPSPDTAYIVWYAIADASWFVRPGSALFKEALKRGASIYFADQSVAMLPCALSRGLISLNANVERRALVFAMQINRHGVCTNTQFYRARIRSRAKLVSDDVSEFLKDPQHHPWAKQSFAKSLERFKSVGLLRLQESRTRNVVHFNRAALDVGLSPSKTAFTLGLDERGDVDLYNEQLSLLCNIEGAAILNRKSKEDPGVLAIFRNHEAPSPHDIDELSRNMADIAKTQEMPPIWHWDRERQSLSDFFDALPEESRTPHPNNSQMMHLYRVRQAMERSVLMMQRRSVFSPQAGLHSALGVNPYARFSAPMREIVGIFTHKEAIDSEFKTPQTLSSEENAKLRECVIEASNRAKALQRNIDKATDSCAIAHVVSHDYDFEFDKRPKRPGTILGMKASALYVRLDMPPIELKVYIRDIAEFSHHSWQLNDSMTALIRDDEKIQYAVGDAITLAVYSYEAHKKKWRVIPIGADA